MTKLKYFIVQTSYLPTSLIMSAKIDMDCKLTIPFNVIALRNCLTQLLLHLQSILPYLDQSTSKTYYLTIAIAL